MHRDQRQAKVADPGEQAVQCGLIGDDAGDERDTPWFGRRLQSVEPVRPPLVEYALDADLVSQ